MVAHLATSRCGRAYGLAQGYLGFWHRAIVYLMVCRGPQAVRESPWDYGLLELTRVFVSSAGQVNHQQDGSNHDQADDKRQGGRVQAELEVPQQWFALTPRRLFPDNRGDRSRANFDRPGCRDRKHGGLWSECRQSDARLLSHGVDR